MREADFTMLCRELFNIQNSFNIIFGLSVARVEKYVDNALYF